MKALAQIILCLVPIATICNLVPYAKYDVDQLEGVWFVQSVFFSDGVDNMNTTQCLYMDFDTTNKAAINTTFDTLYGTYSDFTSHTIYLPVANGSAIFANKYADGYEKFPLEVIDTSSIQPWKDDKNFPISILCIRDIDPNFNGIFAVYAVSRQINVPLDQAIFRDVLKALGVEEDELDYFVSMNNANC